MKQKRKGFTLVELIVVIAIIGILAAVLIPTFSGAIESARYANDQAAARNMSTIVKQYCMLNGVDEEDLQAPDIRYIINTSEEFYTFRPSSSDGVFWYNRSTGNVEVTRGVVPVGGTAVSAAAPGNSIEEVLRGQIYLNTEGELANALNKLRNLTNPNDYKQLVEQAKEPIEGVNISDIVDAYNPATTLFIGGTGNEGYFTQATGQTTQKDPITKVVFASDIQVLSGTSQPLTVAETLTNIKLPVTVTVIEAQNPLQGLESAEADQKISVTTAANSQKVTVVEGALNGAGLSASAQLGQTVSAADYESKVAEGNVLIRVISQKAADGTIKTYQLDKTQAEKFAKDNELAKLSLVEDVTTVTELNRIGQIITKDLMEKFSDIHTLSVTYRPAVKGSISVLEARIIAVAASGKVADLTIVAAR